MRIQKYLTFKPAQGAPLQMHNTHSTTHNSSKNYTKQLQQNMTIKINFKKKVKYKKGNIQKSIGLQYYYYYHLIYQFCTEGHTQKARPV